MAGSHSQVPIHTDPVLAARLEALQLLADRVADRVMVIGPDLTVIYANQAAWSGNGKDRQTERPAKCYEAFLHRADPCKICSAKEVFEDGQVRSASCSTGESSACGMKQAFPLLTKDQETAAVLVFFDTVNHQQQVRNEESDGVEESRLGELIGCSPAMRQLFDTMKLVADSQATVLLQGESGAGKELVARTIHRLSDRRDKPFVVVDCGALPETLLESELFGHVKGAFTGAHVMKPGLFEEASGGTIFLDEIADTSPSFQGKLLRVLQEGEIKPVGSSRSVKVDVRVISAANKDLVELIKAKAFREDLYYRLAVLPLTVPPLRERREDIPLLVRHFVDASCERHRRPILAVAPEAMQALTDAPWPGNVRELQHAIERAVVTAKGTQLAAQDFFNRVETVSSDDADLRSIARTATQRAERVRIAKALRDANGNRAKAAKLMKISRASLYNKLRAYQIDE